jgi:hypothetical protein
MADNNVKKWYVVRVSKRIKWAYIETEISRLEMEDYVLKSCSYWKSSNCKDGKVKEKVYFPVMLW